MPRKAALLLLVFLCWSGLFACARPEPAVEPTRLARYMPADTPLFVALNLKPGRSAEAWRRLRDALRQAPAVQEALNDFQASLPFLRLAEITPRLGEAAAIAVLDLRAPEHMDRNPAEEVPFLLAISVDHPGAFTAFQERMETQAREAAGRTAVQEYHGMALHTLTVEDRTISYALTDDGILPVARAPETLGETRERPPEGSLQSNAQFQALLGYLPSGGPATGYLYGDRAAVLLHAAALA